MKTILQKSILIAMLALFGLSNVNAQYTKLLDFAGIAYADGSHPNGSLISDGTFLYGMTRFGGANDKGTIFKYGITNNIADNNTEPNFNIFPNPTIGKFTVALQNAHQTMSLQIFNVMGEKVIQQQNINEIDLFNSPKGIYFIKITDGKKITIKKL